MGRVLIIGAGGVGTVVAHKVAQNAEVLPVFSTNAEAGALQTGHCSGMVPSAM